MPEIKKGISTWATIVGGIVAAAPATATQIIAALENVQTHWSGAEKTGLIVGAATIIVGALGRFAQSVAAILRGPDGKQP